VDSPSGSDNDDTERNDNKADTLPTRTVGRDSMLYQPLGSVILDCSHSVMNYDEFLVVPSRKSLLRRGIPGPRQGLCACHNLQIGLEPEMQTVRNKIFSRR
jgi:hypothetical protein